MEKEYYLRKATQYNSSIIDPTLASFVEMIEKDSELFPSPRDVYNGDINDTYYQKFFGKKGVRNTVEHLDIMSGKVKVLLSFEYSRPFEDKIYAVNIDATTRREEETFERIKDYTIRSILMPIEVQLGNKYSQMEPDKAEIAIQEELDSIKPKRVNEYMKYEHQDIADIAGNQVLEFLKERIQLKSVYDDGLLDAAISRTEAYRIFEDHGHPNVALIQGECISYCKSNYSEYIEDSDIIVVKYRWTLERIKKEVKPNAETLNLIESFKSNSIVSHMYDVSHILWRDTKPAKKVWKKDRKDEWKILDNSYEITDEEEMEVVEADVIHYSFFIENAILAGYGEFAVGDISERLTMPYYGRQYKDWFVRRMYKYQFLYNVINEFMLRLIKRNKGKKIALDPARATTNGINLSKFLEYLDQEDVIFLKSKTEGNKDTLPMRDLAHEIDMSHTSDIEALQRLMNYFDLRAGESVGIPKQMEAQIQEREGVKNVDKVFGQTLKLLEPYLKEHDQIKKRVTLGLISMAQKIYKKNPPETLNYALSDASINFIKFSPDVFSISSYAMFMQNTSSALEKKSIIHDYLRLYAQNPNAMMSSIIEVVMTNNPTEALNKVKAYESNMLRLAAESEKSRHSNDMELEKLKGDNLNKNYDRQISLIKIKESENRKTELYKAAITALGFPSGNTDNNNNNTPDVIDQALYLLKEREVKIKEFMAQNAANEKESV